MGTYERKTREIQRTLHRRARMRRAYFKMTGQDAKDRPPRREPEHKRRNDTLKESNNPEKSSGEEPESLEPAQPDEKLTKKQLASRRRAEAYHDAKEAESAREEAKRRRRQLKEAASARTSKGQPRLGAQVGMLLDKIRKNR